MARFTKPRIPAQLLRRKTASKSVEDFGEAGKPVDTTHPFYFGFMVTVGALIALTTLRALASARETVARGFNFLTMSPLRISRFLL